jgi:2-C-methyl-D-erythritol 4-phosphate cytidylyltransferase
LIAAAGSGRRLGAGEAKAWLPLAGRPMVGWSVEAFRGAERIGPIVVAAPPGEGSEVRGQKAEALGSGVEVIPGGASRSESVALAMERVETEVVVVHDAARPLVTPELIDAVLAGLVADPGLDGLVAAAPVSDTIKRVDERRVVVETPDRSSLWAVQTPQAFRTDALRHALEGGELETATDDAILIERAGGTVGVHPAPAENLKVTTALDLRVAEMLLAARG